MIQWTKILICGARSPFLQHFRNAHGWTASGMLANIVDNLNQKVTFHDLIEMLFTGKGLREKAGAGA